MLPLLNINSASVIGWLESAAAQQWIVGILLVLLFISFIKEWMPVEITALTGSAVLMLTDQACNEAEGRTEKRSFHGCPAVNNRQAAQKCNGKLRCRHERFGP